MLTYVFSETSLETIWQKFLRESRKLAILACLSEHLRHQVYVTNYPRLPPDCSPDIYNNNIDLLKKDNYKAVKGDKQSILITRLVFFWGTDPLHNFSAKTAQTRFNVVAVRLALDAKAHVAQLPRMFAEAVDEAKRFPRHFDRRERYIVAWKTAVEDLPVLTRSQVRYFNKRVEALRKVLASRQAEAGHSHKESGALVKEANALDEVLGPYRRDTTVARPAAAAAADTSTRTTSTISAPPSAACSAARAPAAANATAATAATSAVVAAPVAASTTTGAVAAAVAVPSPSFIGGLVASLGEQRSPFSFGGRAPQLVVDRARQEQEERISAEITARWEAECTRGVPDFAPRPEEADDLEERPVQAGALEGQEVDELSALLAATLGRLEKSITSDSLADALEAMTLASSSA